MSKVEDMPHGLVVVQWLDSAEPMDNSEIEEVDFPEPQEIYQVGMLVREADEYITVASAYKPDPGRSSYDYVISIPRAAIIKLTML